MADDKNTIDEAHEWTDEKIAALEEEIERVFTDGRDAISMRWKEYNAASKPRGDELWKAWQEAIENGDEKEIKAAEKEYKAWLNTYSLQNERFAAMANDTAQALTETNKITMAVINDALPETYAHNYNFMARQSIDHDSEAQFVFYDEKALFDLSTRANVLNLPYKEIDEEKDKRWNVRLINSEMQKALLSGDSPAQLAGRLDNVIEATEVQAMRAARTLITATENQARQEEMEDAEAQGLDIQKEWITIRDDRTREWHLELHKKRVNVGESFKNSVGEIRYPGDMTSDPANVYNCRCALIQKYGKTGTPEKGGGRK